MADIVETLRELRDTMPLPERVKVAIVTAAGEIVHLREQRDRLQKRGSELVKERQVNSPGFRLQEMATKEMDGELVVLTRRALLAERVAWKLAENFDEYDAPAEFLSEDECYVLERIDYYRGLLGPPNDPSCKEPTCTRKDEPHVKPCGCTWDHVANRWAPCAEHAPPKGPAIIGGSRAVPAPTESSDTAVAVLQHVTGDEAANWHDGEGWYWWEEEYPEGSHGAFKTRQAALRSIHDADCVLLVEAKGEAT